MAFMTLLACGIAVTGFTIRQKSIRPILIAIGIVLVGLCQAAAQLFPIFQAMLLSSRTPIESYAQTASGGVVFSDLNQLFYPITNKFIPILLLTCLLSKVRFTSASSFYYYPPSLFMVLHGSDHQEKPATSSAFYTHPAF